MLRFLPCKAVTLKQRHQRFVAVVVPGNAQNEIPRNRKSANRCSLVVKDAEVLSNARRGHHGCSGGQTQKTLNSKTFL